MIDEQYWKEWVRTHLENRYSVENNRDLVDITIDDIVDVAIEAIKASKRWEMY